MEREIACIHPNCEKPMVERDDRGPFFFCDGKPGSEHPHYLVSSKLSFDGLVTKEELREVKEETFGERQVSSQEKPIEAVASE
jgi:hypothetical protein